jgi:hypothetical protein
MLCSMLLTKVNVLMLLVMLERSLQNYFALQLHDIVKARSSCEGKFDLKIGTRLWFIIIRSYLITTLIFKNQNDAFPSVFSHISL